MNVTSLDCEGHLASLSGFATWVTPASRGVDVGTPGAVLVRMNVGDHFEALTASLSKLIGLHIKLARLEAAQDVKAVGARAIILVAVVPAAWAAFVLLTAAIVVALCRVMPVELAFGAVGLVYAVGALLGGLAFKRSLATFQAPMNDSVAEVANTLDVVGAGRSLSHG